MVALSLPETRAQSVSVTAKVPGVCGNGIAEVDEQCDGSDLNGQSCTTQGFTGGTLQCNLNCTLNTSSCTTVTSPAPSSNSGGVAHIVLPSFVNVVIRGRAYPEGLVTLLVDGRVQNTVRADSQALFDWSFVLNPGAHDFSLYSTDLHGRRSPVYTFSKNLLGQATSMFPEIFLAPTIKAEKTEVKKGDILNIHGQAAPSSRVSVFVDSENAIAKTVTAEKDGAYLLSLNTDNLAYGDHTAKIQAELGGMKSLYSSLIKFAIGEKNILRNLPADENGDGRVNIVDLSIILYWWGETPKETSRAADINKDGQINLKDLSVMLYYWTG